MEEHKFELVSNFKPTGDQPKAIEELTKGIKEGKKLQEGLDLGAKAAHEGSEATKTHVATLGRAGTVGERSIGYPDAGAHGLDVIFNELAKFIKNF